MGRQREGTTVQETARGHSTSTTSRRVARPSRSSTSKHEGRASLLARLAWHLDQGHDVVIVSASPQIYVDVMTRGPARDRRARHASRRRPSRSTDGRLPRQELSRHRENAPTRRMDRRSATTPTPPVIYAYGNSRGDRRMLSGATYPFNVGKLGWLGSLRRYPAIERRRRAEFVTADESRRRVRRVRPRARRRSPESTPPVRATR